MLRVLGIATLLLVGGCATTPSTYTAQNYDRVLNAWLGWETDSLAFSWGPPDRTEKLSGGLMIWEYTVREEQQRGGDTYYTYETVETTETVTDEDGKTTTYERKKTIPVEHTRPTYTAVFECVTRFSISPAGIIRNWTRTGNDCKATANSAAQAEEARRKKFAVDPTVVSAAAPVPTGSAICAGAAPVAAIAPFARDYPNAHISILSAEPFVETVDVGDASRPPSVVLDHGVAADRRLTAAFAPMHPPVRDPRSLVVADLERTLGNLGAAAEPGAYVSWRGHHAASAVGMMTEGGRTVYRAMRAIWLDSHGGTLMLSSTCPSRQDAVETLRAFELGITIL